MNTLDTPTCPACGFTIFNRRYPRCESCHAELHEPLVYGPAERARLLAEDEAIDFERQHHTPSPDVAVSHTIDDAIMAGVNELASR